MRETKVICDMRKQEIKDIDSAAFTFNEVPLTSISSGVYLDLCEDCLKKVLRLFGKNENHFSRNRR